MEPKCPLCGLSSRLMQHEIYKVWTLKECPDCALQFFWPLRHPGASYYHVTYVAHQDASCGGYPLGWYHEQFLRNPPHNPPLGRTLLDVGCGPGMFLAQARILGYQVSGLDVNRAALLKAEQLYGLQPGQLLAGTLDDWVAKFPGRQVDVITAFEILEHLEDPAALLESAHGLLAPDGFLAMSVPNRERLFLRRERSDYPPHHLTRWSPLVLRQALVRCGFSVLQVICQVPTPKWAIQHLIEAFSFFNVWRVARSRAAAAVHGVPSVLVGLRGVNRLLRDFTRIVLLLPALLLTGYGRMARRPALSVYVLAKPR